MNELHAAERAHLSGLLKRMLKANSGIKAHKLRDTIVETYGKVPGFPRKLRRAMFDRELSGARLARELRVSPAWVSALLSGRSKPRPEMVSAIARILQVDDETLEPHAG